MVLEMISKTSLRLDVLILRAPMVALMRMIRPRAFRLGLPTRSSRCYIIVGYQADVCVVCWRIAEHNF
jgi:hypothetical protein